MFSDSKSSIVRSATLSSSFLVLPYTGIRFHSWLALDKKSNKYVTLKLYLSNSFPIYILALKFSTNRTGISTAWGFVKALARLTALIPLFSFMLSSEFFLPFRWFFNLVFLYQDNIHIQLKQHQYNYNKNMLILLFWARIVPILTLIYPFY